MKATLGVIPMLVSAVTLASGPAFPQADAQAPAGHVIAADDGVVRTHSSERTLNLKVGSISTGASQLFVATAIVPPGVETSVHLHEVDEEVLYVLEGEITLTLNEVTHKVSAGGTAFIPPGTWMQVVNTGATAAHILGILSRGELERCFRALYSPPEQETSERDADLATCRMRQVDTQRQH